MSRIAAVYALGAAALVGSLLLFDHQRRNNAWLRDFLRSDQLRADKLLSHSKPSFEVPTEEVPTTHEGVQEYFMRNIQAGETLAARGFI